jgi:8-hydroxy-5-deazaflavin:NADPH oxidoreductase
MRIGIIGSGHIGETLAKLFSRAGHQVAVSNSRGPETLRDEVEEIGGDAQAMTTEDAARFGEIVVVAVPFGRIDELPAGDVAGKVVVDANNYYAVRDGHYEALDTDRTTSSELLADQLAGARVVKAFNAMYWEHLRDAGRPEGDPERLGIPISGDDADARRTVALLIDEIGFGAVDAGTLAEGGRKHQPEAAGYGRDLPVEELRQRLAG